MMKLEGLISLYKSMKHQAIDRYKFRYQHNHLEFDCLFFIDIKPFEIVLGCPGHNFVIFLEVQQGFQIEPFIEPKQTFFALIDALKTTDDSFNRFDPSAFFAAFDKDIPDYANPQNIPTSSDIIRYYSDIEEADKKYFCGWLDNNIQSNQVTEANLNKTRRLLGQRAYDFSKRRNQSTRWTHENSKAIQLFIPD